MATVHVVKICSSLGILKSSRTLFVLTFPFSSLLIVPTCTKLFSRRPHWLKLSEIILQTFSEPHAILNKIEETSFLALTSSMCLYSNRSWAATNHSPRNIQHNCIKIFSLLQRGHRKIVCSISTNLPTPLHPGS